MTHQMQSKIYFAEAEAYDRTLALIDDKLANVTIHSPKYNLLAQLVEVMDANNLEVMEATNKIEAHGRTVAWINDKLGGSRYGSHQFRILQQILEALTLQ